MYYKAYALIAILLASVASVALVSTANAQTTSVTVQTGKTAYASGDEITMSGTVTNIQAGQPILIRVMDPKGALARTDQVTSIAADGSWTYSFPSGGPLMKLSGEYTVIATYRNVSQETTFDFTSSEWNTWTLTIDGGQHKVRYKISGGTVSNMQADVATSTLTVSITSTSAGNLTLELPRNVMQSLSVPNVPSGGSDVDYEVFIDDAGVTIDPDVKAADTRTLTIDFPAGAEKIEVVGTWIVPEFGAIAAIILAIAIVGIIVATTRYGKFNSFLPRH